MSVACLGGGWYGFMSKSVNVRGGVILCKFTYLWRVQRYLEGYNGVIY